MWIFYFLLERPKRVCVNDRLSDTVCIFTGSPQCCVLSPLLFTLYINNCRSCHENKLFVKCSDDTAIVSLLLGDQDDHGRVASDFVN